MPLGKIEEKIGTSMGLLQELGPPFRLNPLSTEARDDCHLRLRWALQR